MAGTRSVFVDRRYLPELGVKGVGDEASIEGFAVRVAGLTERIAIFHAIALMSSSSDPKRQISPTSDRISTKLPAGKDGSGFAGAKTSNRRFRNK